ncbi:hypothetical protein ACFVOR_14885 [Streptomyces sp. NPDC057837]|uniref:hypothetical protein n=1 Tax=Streptomyces sp. NPDC057837 TaxID=3346260 RepID=UPI00367FCD08
MVASSQTQGSAALALTQLLTEHSELAPANWQISRDGGLTGTVAVHADSDELHTAMRAYAAVLGGTVHEQHFHSREAGPSLSVSLHATWRDVQVDVWGSCVVPAGAEHSAVAA